MTGRWALGALRNTGLEEVRGEMGWTTFRERISKGKLSFMKKMEGLGEERWAKKIIMEDRPGSTWRREMSRWKKRENLEDDWNRLTVKDINRKIEANGLRRWRTGMERKPTLKWYTRKQKPEKIGWHTGDWGSRLLFKARSGTLEVNGRKREEQEQSCSFCVGVKETIEHLIVECDGYEGERKQLKEKVIAIIGEEEWYRRLEEGDGGITTVLGLYGDIKESDKIVKCTKKFLVQLEKERNRD